MFSWTSGDGQTDEAGGSLLRHNKREVQIESWGECVIWRLATTLLVLVLGITAMVPLALTQVSVAPTALPTASGSGGGVSGGNSVCPLIGPCTLCPLIGPCYEPQ
jgi:hypothetical protein